MDDVADAVDTELSPLTPRPVRRPARTRRWIAAVVIVAVTGGVALLIANLLGDAALFFYNADEAVERREELASQRFRLQGTPLVDPVHAFWDDQAVLAFSVGFNGATVDVVHTGDPPELFQAGVPVVLEGSWRQGPGPGPVITDDGWHFASDRMLVKHDNDYRSRDDYDERIVEADEGVFRYPLGEPSGP
ncbi:MAG: cytochrome c maturation protein CcmE [Acidimicrobiaceae bacterium]|nr:cytochrome c maturation protein CcmE [Acidimicrobiaceae bacterium]